MTKFENIGVELQYSSKTIEESNARYEKSCMVCCCRGIYILGGCEHCAIRQTHKLVIATFKGGEQNVK